MLVKDFFGQINYLAISVFSHSKESNGEDNRKALSWGPLFFGSQELGRPLKESNVSQSGTLIKAAVESMKVSVLELVLMLCSSTKEVSGLVKMVGKAPREAYWLYERLSVTGF